MFYFSDISLMSPLTDGPVLQIRRGNWDNSGIIIHIFHKNIFSDTSLETSRRDGSTEGSQHMFSLRNKKNIFKLFSIPPSPNPFYLELCRPFTYLLRRKCEIARIKLS